jgi:hypothetical protein
VATVQTRLLLAQWLAPCRHQRHRGGSASDTSAKYESPWGHCCYDTSLLIVLFTSISVLIDSPNLIRLSDLGSPHRIPQCFQSRKSYRPRLRLTRWRRDDLTLRHPHLTSSFYHPSSGPGWLKNAVADSPWNDKRDVALINVMARAGLRVSETLALKIGDVELGPGSGTLLVREDKRD